jgi:hypothetical protein
MVVLSQTDPTLGEALSSVITFLPKLAACIAILIVGYLLARLLERVLGSVLERIGFGRIVERSGVQRLLAGIDRDATTLLTRVVFYGAMLFVLQLAFGIFGPNPISQLLYGLIAFLPRVFVAIVIVVIAAAIAVAVRDVVRSMLRGVPYGHLLGSIAYAVILGVGVFAALDQLAIAPTIVAGLFYALLAIVVGVTVVAVGGGGIAPMRARWERALTRLDDESVRMRESAQQERARRQAEEQRRREEEEAVRRRQAEEQRRREEEEAERRRQAEEQRRREEEEAERRRQAEEQRRREEEEAERRRQAEEQVIRSTPPPEPTDPAVEDTAPHHRRDVDDEADPTLAFDPDETQAIRRPVADPAVTTEDVPRPRRRRPRRQPEE